jgi:hypothetical protein
MCRITAPCWQEKQIEKSILEQNLGAVKLKHKTRPVVLLAETNSRSFAPGAQRKRQARETGAELAQVTEPAVADSASGRTRWRRKPNRPGRTKNWTSAADNLETSRQRTIEKTRLDEDLVAQQATQAKIKS